MRQPISFGKYLLLERINVGGMAEIYLARSRGVQGFRRILAIKKILPTMAEDDEFIAMFIDEARIAAELSHAGIVQIFELGKFGEDYYIAMEFVHGKDLRFIQERQARAARPVDVHLSSLIAFKLLEALDYAHNKRDPTGRPLGIIHRDISPQNVILSFEGEVKICDFGIAKAANRGQKTQAGVLKGKFGYMSPEQVRGLPLDGRSDLFTVGTLLYEMVTLERLFVGESDFSTLEKVRNADVVPPSTYNREVPEELEDIILRALSKEVEDRFQSAQDMAESLQAFLMHAKLVGSRELSAFLRETFRSEYAAEVKRIEDYHNMPEPAEDQLGSVLPADMSPDQAGEVDVDPDGKTLIFASKDEQGQVRSGPPPVPTGKRKTDPGVAPGSLADPLLGARTMIFEEASIAPPTDAKTVIFDEAELEGEAPTIMLDRPPAEALVARPIGSGRSTPEKLFPWVSMLAALLVGYSFFTTWRLTHATRPIPAEAPPYFELSTYPPTGIQVHLDERLVAEATPARFEDVPAGEHHLKVSRAGYETYERRLELLPNQRLLLEVGLRPRAEPSGGSADAGPEAAAPDAGPVAVASSGDGADAGTTAPPPAERASLSVKTTPPGAVVLLGGKRAGVTPMVLEGLEAGRELRLRLELRGHKPHAEQLTLRAGETREWLVSLTRKAGNTVRPPPPPPPKNVDYGYLLANTRPWSKVYVDGKYTGRETPIPPDKKLKLTVGKHKVTFETPGGQRYDFDVEIKLDETQKLIKKLE